MVDKWGDAVGMMWQDALKASGTAERVLVLPPTTWTPPTALPELPTDGLLCVDVETKDTELKALGPGFLRPGNHIIGLAIGTEDGRRFYFPVRHEGGENMLCGEETVKAWAKAHLNRFTGWVVGAKLSYDLGWLRTWGVTFPNARGFHDIQILEPLLDEWRFSYSLDALAFDYLGIRKVEGELERVGQLNGWSGDAIKSNLWRMAGGHVGRYAEGDVDLPLRILPLQLAKIEAEGLQHIYEIERKLIPLLVQMKWRGCRVDIPKAEIVKGELEIRRNDILKKIRHIAGQQAEFMAPETLVKALTARGLAVPLTPKSKAPSITKPWLEKFRSDELVRLIYDGRKLNTTINTFINGHILGHSVNGRIHCDFNQLKGDEGGTIARFSSSLPNLQNLPARDEELMPLIRGIFIPEDGEEWQLDDYSQVEYRLLVHYAIGQGAEEARALYNSDPATDFHKYVAKKMNIDPDDKIRRGRVKSVNFAKGYGAQAKRLASLMNCSEEDAKEFIAQYDHDLPFALETFKACERWMSKRGFVTTILGRKQRCTLWEPRNNYGENMRPPLPHAEALKSYGTYIQRYMTYAAMNRKFQASGADILKKAMVDGYEAGICNVIGPYLLTVHDELDNSIPKTKLGDEAGKELTHIMTKAVELKVPLLVSSERGENWGKCK